jgi:gliding motility-associated-like protein
LLIFNRWGEIVFSSDKPDFAWDGTYDGSPVKEGVYVWKVDFGVINTDERRSINGFINLMR